MGNEIYLALYKGNGRKPHQWLEDGVIRLFTLGKYSHCEIAIKKNRFRQGERIPDVFYECYSSSPREGGVRCKEINLEDGKWDLIPLDISEEQVKSYFHQTKGKLYDFWGAIGIVLRTKQHKEKYFCSE